MGTARRTTTIATRIVGVGLAVALVAGLAACSDDDEQSGDIASTGASSAESSTTTERDTTATTRASTGTTGTTGGSSGTTVAGGDIPVEREGWFVSASQYRGRDGERFAYRCPPGGPPVTVWGTDVYTDDSSVCTAAVHMGKITLEAGGTVQIEIRPGLDSYTGSTRNGITTLDYPAWGGSYVFVD